MVYELRKWSGGLECLYTDDPRVRDVAKRSKELRVVATYFRRSVGTEPFAWDIVGSKDALARVSHGVDAARDTRRGRKAAVSVA